MEKIIEILNQFGIPFAYDHFSEGEAPDPPFICYMIPSTDNFAADGTVYLDIDVVNIELYTDKKDPELEKKLQGLLTESRRMKRGSNLRSCTKWFMNLKWRLKNDR